MTTEIKGIIFDLDDTLFDCTGQLTQPARRRAAEILSQANPDLSVETGCQQQTQLAQTQSSSDAIRALGSQYNIPATIIQQALDAYNTSQVEDITLFPDAFETLNTLSQNGYRFNLVTSGHPNRQRSKVDLLNIKSYFSEANNTLILHDDSQSSDKTPCLVQAADHLSLPHNEILAVGDKLTAEISAANRLSMTTVHLRHGRQKDRMPQTPEEHPDYQIDRLAQLLTLLT